MHRFAIPGLLTLCAVLCGEAQAASLIRNGSFEAPVVQVGGYALFNRGQRVGYWRVVGADGNVAPVSGQFRQNGFAFPARHGAQFLDLTGISNTATGVSQPVATTPGTAYDLTFFVGNVVNPGGIFGVTSRVDVSVDGALLMSVVNSAGSGSATMVWRRFSTTFTATGTTTNIAFINGDPSNDTACALDAVTLVPHVPAMPNLDLEPALFEHPAR